MFAFIFSKVGIFSILSVVLLSSGAYVTNLWNNKTIEIEQQKSQITQYKSDLGSLKTTVNELNLATRAQDDILGNYIRRSSELEIGNNKLTNELSIVRSKLAVRDMENLKRSVHAELVLKIINKSIIKQTLEWNSHDAS